MHHWSLRAHVLTFCACGIGCGFFLVACDAEPRQDSRYNVLLLSADSLRSDRLALWNPEGVETPNLEALAARGALYRNAVAVTPWTAPSMVSVFTGLYPPSHGVVYRDDTTPPNLPNLARILSESGYRIGNFTFFSEISYFRGLGLGPSAPQLQQHGREPQAFRDWLADGERGQPFFAWIHLLETHLPYGASGYRATEVQVPGSSGLERSQLQATVPVGSAEFVAGDREALLRLYDDDIERLDQVAGEVLSILREQQLEERTIVVFVADHGEELLDDGWVGHASTSLEAKLRPELLWVPLILAGPGVEPGQRLSELVQQVDILPSVLGLLGASAPAHIDGISLPGTPRLPTRGKLSWLAALRQRIAGSARHRALAYFDTSMGGNLTPVERIGERLQGVTDGECLLVSHVLPATSAAPALPSVSAVRGTEVDCEGRRGRLEGALASWREEQARQRLEILRAQAAPDAPGAEAESFLPTIVVRRPLPDQELVWGDAGGQIELEWESPATSFWVEYEAGSSIPFAAAGAFQVQQNRLLFGPFPQGFWNDVAGYGPFRLRVLDPAGKTRSPWVTFSLREAKSDDDAETDQLGTSGRS